MSRPPIRDVFRLAHLGLEKVALACAAFSLMHATARADESVPPEPLTVDQWAAQSGAQPAAQPADQTARRASHDDPWANPVAARLAHDDTWSAPAGDPFRSGEQLHVAKPAPQTVASAAPSIHPPRPSSALVMDRSDWNETPRGRSPGLIASNNAWRKRIAPEAAASIQRSAAEQDLRSQPAAVLKLDSNLQLDPWSAPAAASKGADNATDWLNLNLASAHQARTCNRDWSVFSGAGCVDSRNPAESVNDNANPRRLPGAQSSKIEQTGSVTMFRQSHMLLDAMAGGRQAVTDAQIQPSGNIVRSRIAMTQDGRWRAPIVLDAEAAPRK